MTISESEVLVDERGKPFPDSLATVSYTHLDVYKRQGYNGLQIPEAELAAYKTAGYSLRTLQ